MYDKFVTEVNDFDNKIPSTSELVTKTQYDSDKQGLEKNVEDVDKKILNASGLLKKDDCNTKITEIENKMARAIALVTTAALNTKVTGIENKIPDITNQATKAALNTKAADVESKD